MSVARSVAAIAAATVLAAINVTTADAQPATPQTLRIGTNGGPADRTVVYYTCNVYGQVCGPATAPAGRWTQTVVAPAGTVVYLQVRWDRAPAPADQYGQLSDPVAPPDCFIDDAIGNTLVNDRGTCIYQAPPPPRPDAPPAN